MDVTSINPIVRESDLSFSSTTGFINQLLCDAITLYQEHAYDESILVVSEASSSLIDRIKLFFVKINEALNRFVDELTAKVETAILEKELKKKLKKYRDEGIKGNRHPLVLPNYKLAKSVLIDNTKKMMVILKTMTTKRYKTEDQINQDFEECQRIFETAEASLDTIMNNPKVTPFAEALNFVSEELDSPRSTIHGYCESLGQFKDISNRCVAAYKQRMQYGNDLLPSRFAFIQKIVNKISGFVRTHTIRLMLKLILIFG